MIETEYVMETVRHDRRIKFKVEDEADMQEPWGSRRTFRPEVLMVTWTKMNDREWGYHATVTGPMVLKSGALSERTIIKRTANGNSAPDWIKDAIENSRPAA